MNEQLSQGDLRTLFMLRKENAHLRQRVEQLTDHKWEAAIECEIALRMKDERARIDMTARLTSKLVSILYRDQHLAHPNYTDRERDMIRAYERQPLRYHV